MRKIFSVLKRQKQQFRFAKQGNNVTINSDSWFSQELIEIGNDVYIGPRANFLSGVAKIIIGNKVLFGPGVTIITGDHRYDIVGEYMFDITEKRDIDDKDVIIEDDVWIGANVIILKGVTVARGSIVGAGSVLTRDTVPYGIYGGNPAKLIKIRFTESEIQEHELLLK